MGGECAAGSIGGVQVTVAQDAHAARGGEFDGCALLSQVGCQVAGEGQFQDDFGFRILDGRLERGY